MFGSPRRPSEKAFDYELLLNTLKNIAPGQPVAIVVDNHIRNAQLPIMEALNNNGLLATNLIGFQTQTEPQAIIHEDSALVQAAFMPMGAEWFSNLLNYLHSLELPQLHIFLDIDLKYEFPSEINILELLKLIISLFPEAIVYTNSRYGIHVLDKAPEFLILDQDDPTDASVIELMQTVLGNGRALTKREGDQAYGVRSYLAANSLVQ